MEAFKKVTKAMQRGIEASYNGLLKAANVIVEDVSSLKKPIKYDVKIPIGKPLGKRVYKVYTVQSTIEPITFKKRKDAEAFKQLLLLSVNHIESDIVILETTEEGFIPTYGEGK